MLTTSNRLNESLRNHGYSVTAARSTVFRILENNEPQTMHQIISKCENIDRASVYRTIELFEKLGIVQRIQVGWKYKIELSDQFQDHHHHLTCTQCGKIIPLHEDTELESQLEKLASKHAFTPTTHQLEIQGLCSECQKS